MPQAYKNARYVQGGSDILYQTAAGTVGVISSVTISNTGGGTATYRLAITNVETGTFPISDYLFYDVEVPGNDTQIITAGLVVGSEDEAQYLRVSGSSGFINFSAHILEIS